MQTILVFGAGKIGSKVISYLLSISEEHLFKVIAADISYDAALKSINNHPNGKAIQISVTDYYACETLIGEQADIVVSMLPEELNIYLARLCFTTGRNLVNSGSCTTELKTFSFDNARLGILFLCDAGQTEKTNDWLFSGERAAIVAVLVLDKTIDTAGVLSCRDKYITNQIDE
jgi:saccharopine dehydrogenase-like NADP-dependent oxidoreductase